MNLNQVTVPSPDLTKSIPFYKKLGLKLIVHTTDDYARFECPDSESTYSISRVDVLPEDEGIYIYFECENLDQYVETLIRNGIEFNELPIDKRWLWREANLKDPDGNRLILYTAGRTGKIRHGKLSESFKINNTHINFYNPKNFIATPHRRITAPANA